MDDDRLNTPRRRALLDAIRAKPGQGFREVARSVGLAAGVVAHHLSVLERHALAWSIVHGPRRRFFAGPRPADDVAQEMARIAGLDPSLAFILAYVREHPLCAQRDIFSAFPGKPRSTIQHAVSRLERDRFLTRTFYGRYVRHRATAETTPGDRGPLPIRLAEIGVSTGSNGVPA